MIVVDTNIAEFQKALTELNAALKRDPAKALRKEGWYLFQQVSAFTPPKNLAQGRAAVKSDIGQIVTPIKASMFTDKSIRALIRGGNIAGIQAFLNTQTDGPLKGKVAARFSPSIHQKRRDKRGKIGNRKGNTVTPDVEALKQYIRRKQGNVGRARGGWVAAIEGLGGRSPKWAARWREMGTFRDSLNNLADAALVGTNNSEWASGGAETRTIRDAFRSRTVQLRTALAAAVRGAAYKSLRA